MPPAPRFIKRRVALPGANSGPRDWRHTRPQPVHGAHDRCGLLLLDKVPRARGRVAREGAQRLRERGHLSIRNTAIVPRGADELAHGATYFGPVRRYPLLLP